MTSRFRANHALSPLLAILFLLGGCARQDPQPVSPEPVRVMSFNIRYDNPGDGLDAWPNRRDRVAGLIRFHGADLAGLQEALRSQIDDLEARLPDYDWIGVGRTDGADEGEFTPIFYRADRFSVQDQGNFWLSETPDVPGSKSWDAALERIATWAIFEDSASGIQFFALNTHFDHIGETARENSAALLVEMIDSLARDLPVVFTGDINTGPDSPPYKVITASFRDALHATEQEHYGPTSTWNGFEAIQPDRRIDFVFVNDAFRVIKHGILSDTWDGRFPSDHLPVLAEVVVRR